MKRWFYYNLERMMVDITEKEYKKAYEGNWGTAKCPKCSGEGWVPPRIYNTSSQDICDLCWGTGIVARVDYEKYINDIKR